MAKRNAISLLLSAACLCLLFLNPSAMQAQTNGCNSSYSRFGLGLLTDQSSGLNKSMGGAGLGVRVGNRINAVNPASYSAIDSLSFIMDVGMKASFGQMKQGTTKAGVNNATLDYVHIGMRLARKLGLTVGFMPYTNIGYSFSSPDQFIAVDENTTQTVTNSNTYSGSGGLNQAYLGLGWKVYRDISIGANISFLWGRYDHYLIPAYMEDGTASSSYSGTIKYYSASLKTYKIDLGAQYPIRLTSQDWLTLGATVGIGHKIAQDAELSLYTTNGDSTRYTASSPFDIPFTFGGGAAWQHKNTLLVAADVHHEWWGACRLPVETLSGYEAMKGGFKNMTKIAVGAQWTPDPFDKHYWKRIQYRAGINYTTPYLKVNGLNGPSELCMSIGAGLPITNRHNSRSVVNFGMQWLRRSASGTGMITENYMLINLGITFNERWFMKFKIK